MKISYLHYFLMILLSLSTVIIVMTSVLFVTLPTLNLQQAPAEILEELHGRNHSLPRIVVTWQINVIFN